MKKLLFVVPLAFALYACGNETDKVATEDVDASKEVTENNSPEDGRY